MTKPNKNKHDKAKQKHMTKQNKNKHDKAKQKQT